jgi:hypothetical protein
MLDLTKRRQHMKQIPVKKKVSGNTYNPETVVMKTVGYAMVDDKYFSELNQYIWTLNSGGYAIRHTGKKGTRYLVQVRKPSLYKTGPYRQR